MEVRYDTHPNDAMYYTTEELSKTFLRQVRLTQFTLMLTELLLAVQHPEAKS